jgi:hypothetical protein
MALEIQEKFLERTLVTWSILRTCSLGSVYGVFGHKVLLYWSLCVKTSITSKWQLQTLTLSVCIPVDRVSRTVGVISVHHKREVNPHNFPTNREMLVEEQ